MKVNFKVCVFYFLLYSAFGFSQEKDSLYRVLRHCSVNDSAVTCNNLAAMYRMSNRDSALFFANLGLSKAKQVHNVFEEGSAENEIGIQYHIIAKYDLALLQYQKAIKLYETLEKKDENSKFRSLASTNQNIGNVHLDQQRYALALKYYLLAIDYQKKINNRKGLAGLYSNIAIIYSTLNNNQRSLEYHQMALDIRTEFKDSSGIASSYGGLAVIYFNLNQLDKAIEYNLKKIAIDGRFGNKRDIVFTYNNLGDCYLSKKDYKKAKECFETGIAIAKQTENYYALTDLYFNQALLFETTHRYKEALASHNDYRSAKDSIFKMESTDRVLELETKYETEKKELQIRNQSLEISMKEKQNKQKTLIIILGALALVVSGFLGTIAFINFRRTKKANAIIESQKQQVELKNKEVTHQKELVEEKQQEIIDSITYAKRIQQAVLTGEDVWRKVSREHFILFMPKDIVSGDFYWAYNTPNGRSVFALADCTGHGVPGGFMSMLGNSFLNEIVVENKLFKADEILNKLRAKVIAALEQKGHSEQKDGMDIALCVWNKMDNTLEFSGANNPLWLVRDGELTVFKGDKMPIGTYLEKDVPFKSVTLQLQKNDMIYMSTDGFADQFGGPKGKKFKYHALTETLINVSGENVDQQKNKLTSTLLNWKMNYEQVDDISLIGLKVV